MCFFIYFGSKQRAVLLWTLDPADRDAQLANEALRGWNPSNRVLIEIACTRNSGELFDVRRAYHLRYKRSLEEDVAKHTTGDFRKVLIYCLMIIFLHDIADVCFVFFA